MSKSINNWLKKRYFEFFIRAIFFRNLNFSYFRVIKSEINHCKWITKWHIILGLPCRRIRWYRFSKFFRLGCPNSYPNGCSWLYCSLYSHWCGRWCYWNLYIHQGMVLNETMLRSNPANFGILKTANEKWIWIVLIVELQKLCKMIPITNLYLGD